MSGKVDSDLGASDEIVAHTAGSGRCPVLRTKLERARTRPIGCILQINVHRSVTAHELLAQFTAETKADLVLISEQYRKKTSFMVPGLIRALTQGEGWLYLDSGITFISVYLALNDTMPDLRRRLHALVDDTLGADGRILVGSNFNAKALEWAYLTQTPEGNEFWKWRREEDG